MGNLQLADRIATVIMYATVTVLGFGTSILPRKALCFLGRGIPKARPSLLQAFRIFAFIVGLLAIVGLVRTLTG